MASIAEMVASAFRAVAAASGEPVRGPPGYIASGPAEDVRKPVSGASPGFTLPAVEARRPSA
eukprot:11325220-Heterocapsa_arctica.AAC.2